MTVATPAAAPADLRARRLAYALPTLALTALAALWGHRLLAADGLGALEAAALVPVVLAYGYTVSQAWQWVLGFALRLARGGRPCALEAAASALGARTDGRTRTAVVMPIYNEDPAAVFAAMLTVARSIGRAGVRGVELFVLSDTQDPAIAAAERAQLARASAEAREGDPRIHYRRRDRNLRRKAGNIADFIARWGDGFDLMLVLDADSLMTGEAVGRLIRLMEARPEFGLVQTLPHPTGRDTLFARVQQFAARAYAPLLVEGLEYWTQADGTYWGHNAILRVDAFRAHCELPVLPGAPPFGGEILCHDVVEAGLLRRGGPEVRLLPGLEGSWEAIPSNVIDFAVRDRRWCQGNLQHLGVLPLRGLPWAHRWHLLNGILAYVAAPLWLLVLGLGALALALDPGGTGPATFAGIAALFWGSLAVLAAPKLLCLGALLADPAARRAFGGAPALLKGAAGEQLFALLAGPPGLVLYGQFVVTTLLGRNVRWDAQARGDRGVGWREALRRHGAHTALGLAGAALLWRLDPAAALWLAPFLLGLALAAPVTVWSSRAGAGRLARRLGLFLTPEETAPAPELRELEARLAAAAAAPRAGPERAPSLAAE